MTEPFTNEDQREFTQHLAHVANHWLGPMPADCQHMNPLPERLAGFVFSLWPELEGAGGLPPYRLSPKGRPDVDLVDHGLHDQWPDVDADNQDVRNLLTAVTNILRRHQQATGQEPRQTMGAMVLDLLRMFEDGYELVPLDIDEDGSVIGEGDDVAPGLDAAGETAQMAITSGVLAA
jgi:hypothetical protein